MQESTVSLKVKIYVPRIKNQGLDTSQTQYFKAKSILIIGEIEKVSVCPSDRRNRRTVVQISFFADKNINL